MRVWQKAILKGSGIGWAGRGASRVSTERAGPQKKETDYVGSVGKGRLWRGLS